MLDRMHAKTIDNFSCCSVAYLSCTACFASFAFALLLSFVLLCTASAPDAGSGLQHHATPRPRLWPRQVARRRDEFVWNVLWMSLPLVQVQPRSVTVQDEGLRQHPLPYSAAYLG